MSQRDDWIKCPECDEEFKLISSVSNEPEYCPYCGGYLALDEDYRELDPDDLDL